MREKMNLMKKICPYVKRIVNLLIIMQAQKKWNAIALLKKIYLSILMMIVIKGIYLVK
jgi:hypothetical protein